MKRSFWNRLVGLRQPTGFALIYKDRTFPKHQSSRSLAEFQRQPKADFSKPENGNGNGKSQTHKSHQIIRDSTASVLCGGVQDLYGCGNVLANSRHAIEHKERAKNKTKEKTVSFRRQHRWPEPQLPVPSPWQQIGPARRQSDPSTACPRPT